MKKLAAILLALVLVLCSVSALAFEPVDKKDLKVGFIYIGGAEDKGFTYAHHEGHDGQAGPGRKPGVLA